MSLEANKAVARRYFEELRNQRKLEIIDEILAPTWVVHLPSGDHLGELEKSRKILADVFERSPDQHDEILSIVAEGDKVAVLHIRTATFENQYGDLSPTGEKMSMWMSQVFRIADGKIAEFWTVMDSVAFEKFLGKYGKSC